jgi:hypothetical protein
MAQERRDGFQSVRDPISRKLILRVDASRLIVEVKTRHAKEPVRVDLKPYLVDKSAERG